MRWRINWVFKNNLQFDSSTCTWFSILFLFLIQLKMIKQSHNFLHLRTMYAPVFVPFSLRMISSNYTHIINQVETWIETYASLSQRWKHDLYASKNSMRFVWANEFGSAFAISMQFIFSHFGHSKENLLTYSLPLVLHFASIQIKFEITNNEMYENWINEMEWNICKATPLEHWIKTEVWWA